jgi:WYL domain
MTFSRAMLTSFAGAPYQDEAERAFMKIERALPAGCRRFLEALPVAIKAKFSGRKKDDGRKTQEVVLRATDALLHHRRVTMHYDSHASRRSRDYIVEPLRVSYADGGTYLTAYVPEYADFTCLGSRSKCSACHRLNLPSEHLVCRCGVNGEGVPLKRFLGPSGGSRPDAFPASI